jgi:hypothetical protein
MPPLPYKSPSARYRRLKDVSTRDSSAPTLAFQGDQLTLQFSDWSGGDRRFTFRDAVAFRWQDAMPLPSSVDADYGSAYEVTASPWLAELAGTEALTPGVSYRHWLFCFHGIESALEVVAAELTAA